MHPFLVLRGLFYRALTSLQVRFPRRYPSTPKGRFLSGDQQLSAIRQSAKGTFKLMGVQVVPFDDSCPVCISFSHRTYPMEAIPPIPLPNCPNGNRCVAIYAPVVDYRLYRVSQLLSGQPKLKVQELRKLLKDEREVDSQTANDRHDPKPGQAID
jgi:hypothetical protein